MAVGAGQKSNLKKPKRNVRREEQNFQAFLVKTLAMVLDPGVVLFAVPNGGFRSKIEAAIFTGQGVLKGMTDLVLLWRGPHGYGRSATMEIKAANGTADEDQEKVHARLDAAGVPVAVIRTLPEALTFLESMGVPFRIKPACIKEQFSAAVEHSAGVRPPFVVHSV